MEVIINDVVKDDIINKINLKSNLSLNSYDLNYLQDTSYYKELVKLSDPNNKVSLDEEVLTISKIIFFRSLPEFLYYFVFNLYFLTAISIYGSKYNDTGLFNSMGIIYYLFYILNNVTVDILLNTFKFYSNEYDRINETKGINFYFQKLQLLCGLISTIICVLTFIIMKLVINYGLANKSIIEFSNSFLNFAFIYPIFQTQNRLNYIFLNYKNKQVFNYVFLLIQYVVFSFLKVILIFLFNVKISSISVSYTISNIITFAAGNIYIYFIIDEKFEKTNLFTNWSNIIKQSIIVNISNYIEYLGFELISLIAYFSGSITFTVYIIISSIYKMIYCFSDTVANACEDITHCSIIIDKSKKVNWFFWISFIITTVINKIFLVIVSFVINQKMTFFFLNDPFIKTLMINTGISFAFALVFHSQVKLYLAFFRGFGMFRYVAFVNLIIYFFINPIYSICFCLLAGMQCTGIYLSFTLIMLVVSIYLLIQYFFRIDIDKVQKYFNENKSSMKVDKSFFYVSEVEN